jgi:hypothetical protein
MSVVSYARLSGNATLWRVLGHIEHGCYLNIGPADPAGQAFSEALDQRGWKGVHVIPDGSPAHTVTLDSLLAQVDGDTVHCMRVHVDGTGSNPLHDWRGTGRLPRAVLVHAPEAQAARAGWEAVLATHGYAYAGSEDAGYVYARPASDLMAQLQALEAELEQSRLLAEESNNRLAEVQARLQQAEERAARLEVEGLAAMAEARQARSLEDRLQAVYASSSWRVTKPMRWLSRVRRSPRAGAGELVRFARAQLVRAGDGLLRRLLRLAVANPPLHRLATRLALRYPALFRRIRARVVPHAPPAAAPAAPVAPSSHTTVLGPRFKTLILDELAHSADPASEGKP